MCHSPTPTCHAWSVSTTIVCVEAASRALSRWLCAGGRRRRAQRTQNDLQAMARCHRIGQAKDVTIYRLVSRDTYEQNVFDCASRKQGAPAWAPGAACCAWLSLFGCVCASVLGAPLTARVANSGCARIAGARVARTSSVRTAHVDPHTHQAEALPAAEARCILSKCIFPRLGAARAQGWTTLSWAASTRRASARTPSASRSCSGTARTRSAPRRSARWRPAPTSPARRAQQRCTTVAPLHAFCPASLVLSLPGTRCMSRCSCLSAHASVSLLCRLASVRTTVDCSPRASCEAPAAPACSIDHLSTVVLERAVKRLRSATATVHDRLDRAQCARGRTLTPSWQGAPRSGRSAAPPATRSAPPRLLRSPRCAPGCALSHFLPLWRISHSAVAELLSAEMCMPPVFHAVH
jgi:hypothetical protein